MLYIQSLSCHLSQFPQSCNIILLGDFNLPDVNWNIFCGNSLATEEFCDMCFKFNLLQLITHSTHIHDNILDLLLTNNEDLISYTLVCHNDNVLSFDHFPFTFKLSFVRQIPSESNVHNVFDYSKAEFHRMNEYVLNSSI